MGLDPTLPALNQTWLSLGPGTFVLLGESGMDALHAWLSAPVCLLYLATLVGNTLLLGLAAADKALQRPMYQLLGLLTASDLVLATSTVPKALAVRRGLSGEISFQACLAQLFVAHVAFIAESSVLWAMAVDCYMAMCRPLRYGALRAQRVVGIVAVAAVTRGACVMAPPVALLRRLPYCGQRALPHTYCEHLGAARLAWSYTRPTVWYGLATTLLSPVLDLGLTGASYALILRTVCHLLSRSAQRKALGTCGAPPVSSPSSAHPPSSSWLTVSAATRCPATSTSSCLTPTWWCPLPSTPWSTECRPSRSLRGSGACFGSAGQDQRGVWALGEPPPGSNEHPVFCRIFPRSSWPL